MQRWLMAFLVLALAASTLSGSPQAPAPGTAERSEILETARIPAQAVLREPVEFQVNYLRVLDGWAFVLADMEDAAGRPVAAGGGAPAASGDPRPLGFAALLNRQQAHWHVVAYGLGPGAVAWKGWAGEYGAPKAIFDLGTAP